MWLGCLLRRFGWAFWMGSVLVLEGGLWVFGGSGVMVEGCLRAAVVGWLLLGQLLQQVMAFLQEEPQGGHLG